MTEVVLLGRLKAHSGRRDDLVGVLLEFAEVAGVQEPEAIQFMLHRDPQDDDSLIVYERYLNEGAFEEHRANYDRVPAYAEFRARMGELMAAPPDIQRLELLTGFVRPELAAPVIG